MKSRTQGVTLGRRSGSRVDPAHLHLCWSILDGTAWPDDPSAENVGGLRCQLRVRWA